MSTVRALVLGTVWLAWTAAPAPAAPDQDAAPQAAPDQDAAPPDEDVADLRRAVIELREANRALGEARAVMAQALDTLTEDVTFLEEQVQKLMPVKGRLSGYLDMGFFHVGGTGAGHRPDVGNIVFPEYKIDDTSSSWVFMGDPLSTAVNARGEPAATGDSRAIRYESIGARSSFVVNTLAVRLLGAVGEDAALLAAFDLVPRGRDISDARGLFYGDFVDVPYAYLLYRPPLAGLDVSLFAGKFDSVLGYEYRVQEAPHRVTVTPSLLCRYVCGHPVGLKARVRLGRAVANVAVTNGSHFQEQFVMADETDRNVRKTVAGRLSYALPWADELELGVSAAIGAQDAQSDDGLLQHHLGVDARVLAGDVEVVAEYVRGRAPGVTEVASPQTACNAAPCLVYQSAYGLVSWRATNLLLPYARVDWRDALHQAGLSFVYVAALWRSTVGVRLDVSPRLIAKIEYTFNRELGRIPTIANDVFTSSFIVTY